MTHYPQFFLIKGRILALWVIHVYTIQPKKQFKVQIIGILEEIDSFYWPKMHLCKGAKKFGQGPPSPPSFGQNPKEQQFFLGMSSLINLRSDKNPHWYKKNFEKNRDKRWQSAGGSSHLCDSLTPASSYWLSCIFSIFLKNLFKCGF